MDFSAKLQRQKLMKQYICFKIEAFEPSRFSIPALRRTYFAAFFAAIVLAYTLFVGR